MNPNTDPDTGFAIFDSEDHETDEAMHAELDLHFIAIFRQMERRQLLLACPSPEVIHEIELHEFYIDESAKSLTPIAHALVQSFRTLIGYDRKSDSPATATHAAPTSDHCLMNLDSDPLASSTESPLVSHAHGDASNAYAYTAVPPTLPLRLPSHFDVIVDFSPHSIPFTQRMCTSYHDPSPAVSHTLCSSWCQLRFVIYVSE